MEKENNRNEDRSASNPSHGEWVGVTCELFCHRSGVEGLLNVKTLVLAQTIVLQAIVFYCFTFDNVTGIQLFVLQE